MRRVTLLLPLLAVQGLLAQASSNREAQPPADSVHEFLRREMQKRRIPGLQLAIVRHGRIVLSGAYGLANIQDSVPVTDQTLFTINSATKAFTGVAMMQLVEDGVLDLEAPVSRYLDSLPVAWRAATVRQLLTHTSGLPDIMDSDARMVSDAGDDSAWAKVQTLPIESAPGVQFRYNQLNYLLLGRIIDKLSRQPFARFIATRQFQVVNMPRTMRAGFGDSHDVVPRSARGYTYLRRVNGEMRRTETLGNVFEVFPPYLRTAAGLSSTATELAQWIIALQQGRLLKNSSSLATLWAPGKLGDGSQAGFGGTLNGYALGWPVVNRSEHRAAAAVGGGRSALFVYPDDDLAVVILTNLQGSSPESFIDEVAGFYVPDMRASNGFGLSPAVKAVRAALSKRGYDHALEVVNELKRQNASFQLAEADVNAWGYRLLEQGQAKDAVEIMALNVTLYPRSANAYDSLAEAYEAVGDRTAAIRNYRRSLELDPKNTNAVAHLKALEGKGSSR